MPVPDISLTVPVLLNKAQTSYLQVILKRKQNLLLRGGAAAIVLWVLETFRTLPKALHTHGNEVYLPKLLAAILTFSGGLLLLTLLCVLVYRKKYAL